MSYDLNFLCECFVTLVALEWPFPSVLPHVLLQNGRSKASIIVLVTLERLFSCMLRDVLKKLIFYGQADRKVGEGVSHLGPDRKQM